jgi:hypothetical protein
MNPNPPLRGPASPPTRRSWLARIGLAITSVVTVVVGLVTASLLFAVLLTLGLVFFVWLWWQRRRLARQAHAARPDYLEGEYTVVPEEHPALEDPDAPERDQRSAKPPRRRAQLRNNRRAPRPRR